MSNTDCNETGFARLWKKMLRKLGYIAFLDKLSHGATADKMKSVFARRLTVLLLGLAMFFMGAMLSQTFYVAFFIETEGVKIFFYQFLGIFIVGFISWLGEVALVVQVRSIVYQPFDERMQQLNAKAKESAYKFIIILLLIALIIGGFFLIQRMDVIFAARIYAAVSISLLLMTFYAPLMILSWQLPSEQIEEDE